MRFANVNDARKSASPGATGTCPACNKPVIAKCGDERVHHWAHLGKRTCDVWWEPRTPWHCEWQDKFPPAWQEVIQHAPSGEKHIADVHTERGLTIEFQYSHLHPDERVARERFYGNMVWIVNGARLRRDLPRFLEGRRSLSPIWRPGVYRTSFPGEVFPTNWLSCAAPVFLDFWRTANLVEATHPVARSLWCLLPGRVRGNAVLLEVRREKFVRWALERSTLFQTRAILQSIEQTLAAENQAEAVLQRGTGHAPVWWRPRKPFPKF